MVPIVDNMAAGRGVQRILDKLKRSIEDKNYYEAHQMYRTLYFRSDTKPEHADIKNLICQLLIRVVLFRLLASADQSAHDSSLLSSVWHT